MGGYPVAGVVCSAHLDRLAGLMPGDVVDLAAVGAESAPAPTRVAVVHVHGLPG
jgi:allophanate hydrolase subunit 2